MPIDEKKHPGPVLLTLASLFLIASAAKLPAQGFVRIDGLALASGGLILFVSMAVAAFAWRHMRASRRREFFALAAALVASGLLFAAADHVLLFALGWVASGLLLAALIGHSEGWEEAGLARLQTRRLFMACDAALVAGLALLTARHGTTSITQILAGAHEAGEYSATLTAALLGVAAVARCALPPFSNWLLASMTAPTPVSALMHAGLVNAGGILVLRFSDLFEAAPLARTALAVLGIAGAIYGGAVMLVRPDVKRALAGSTVSQMGFMLLACGLGAYAAALWHLVAHGLFKAWLFLGSGANARVPLVKLDGRVATRAAGLAIVATLGSMAIMVSLGLMDLRQGSFIPVTFAILTAFLTVSMLPYAFSCLRDAVRMSGLLAALLGLHALGLAGAQSVVGSDGPPLLSAYAQIAIASVFVGLFVLQSYLAARRKSLPPRIYVNLLNAGSSHG